jgi:hypothetical protein
MRVVLLFAICTLAAYGVNVLLRNVPSLGWIQFFDPTATTLLPGLAAATLIGHNLHWLSLKATAGQYSGAALLVAASYPLAFVKMLVLTIAVSALTPESLRESGSGLKSALDQAPVYLAALVIPAMCWAALGIVGGRWDGRDFLLMCGAVVATLASIVIAGLLRDAGAGDFAGGMFFPGFPVGFSLIAGAFGYGLARSGG